MSWLLLRKASFHSLLWSSSYAGHYALSGGLISASWKRKVLLWSQDIRRLLTA